MFDTYNTRDFGSKLKELRSNLGFTQSEVSLATGINSDTLRKLENGYSLPRYDTLCHLSSFYKTDIHKLFVNYQHNNLLYSFYKTLDQLMIYGKFDEIKKSHLLFLETLNQSNELQLVDKLVIEQIDLYILSLSQRYKGNPSVALNNIIDGLSLTNSIFSIEYFDKYKYNSFEIRLLVVAAACLGDLRKCELSNKISAFIVEYLSCDLYSEKSEDILYIKSLSNISYNHHRMHNNGLALKFAQDAIKLSLEKGHLDMLHFLFLREAVAKLYLGDQTYMDSFKKCLYTIKITGEETHFQYMLKLIKDKYHLTIDII